MPPAHGTDGAPEGPRQGHRAHLSPTSVGLLMAQQSGRRVLFVNPKSGGGKAERFDLVAECRKRGILPVVMAPGDDVRELALGEVSAGAEVIGMAGGDGSQAAVATVASAHDVPFVCVPAGTRNHFAADIGLDRRDVVGALDAFDDEVERRIDMASVNGRDYLNAASLGLYARIVRSPQYREMKVQTVAELLPSVLGPGSDPFDLRFTGPGGVAWTSAHLLLVSNNRYEPVNLGGQGARSRMDSGLLGVIAAVLREPGEVAALIAAERAGAIQHVPPVSAWSTPTFRVDSDSPIEIALDGEAAVMEPPLLFASRPGALRIRLPLPRSR